MVVIFEDDYLAKLYSGRPVKGKPRFSEGVVTKFKKTVLMLKRALNTVELSTIRSLHFEALKGEKSGLFSVRVDDTYRVEFRIAKDGVLEIIHIEELSKHYK
jgi:toxin HigB-1